jgi:hypothetical protein
MKSEIVLEYCNPVSVAKFALAVFLAGVGVGTIICWMILK